MAHIYLKGNLGTDPRVRVSDKGQFLTFPLYEDDFRNGSKRATKFEVAVYSSLKEYCSKHLIIGCRVFVGGRFRVKKAENGSTFLHIILEEIEIVRRPKKIITEVGA